MKRVLIALFSLTIALTAVAADSSKPLTRAERKERVAKLSDKHRSFLLEVEPILTEGERDTFLRLETEAQRDVFIEDFWRRRDIAAGTTGHAYREDYYERLELVRTKFDQIMSDRGRIYLIHGTPAMLVEANCTQYFVPLQIWYYPYLPGYGRDVSLLFFQNRNDRVWRLWSPRIDGVQKLIGNDIESRGTLPLNTYTECKDGEAIMAGINYMRLNEDRMMKIYTPPPVNEEDVNRILRSSVVADPKAPKLEAAMTLAYPSSDGSKTDAQLTILVPRSQLKITTVNDVSVYTLDVVGEVLRDGKMWERFRYRFDYPGDVQDEKLPIVIDRPLRPATYSVRVKLTDTATNAQTILSSDAVVPEMAATAPKPTEETTALATIQQEMQSSRASLRIVPLTDEVISGLQTIQTLVTGGGISAVEFYLDGKKVATRRSPPYKLDLDFGTMPRSRRVRVVAIDSHGAPITGDEVVVNTGTDPFRVRIASPRVAPKLSGPTKVEMEVKVPEGKELGSVELYWNETRVATLYDPPFVQTVNIPSADGVGYLRAVAMLKDPEADPVEDVVMVNTPEFMANVEVHLVELPTTVLAGGKPVNDLQEQSFKVLDEGQPVKLAKFEHVKDLPLSIGMAVDTSGSMEDRIAVARDAGAAFFGNVMRKGDKAFLVAFDSQPHIVQKWSPDLKDIYSGLAKMRAEESTALYDAVVYSLYNFSGVKGQKALILLTDGRDTVSKFSFEQALEYAQRAAVPIYTVGISIHGMDIEVKSKLNRLAGETGGTSYYIDTVGELSKIYTDIQNELRSQYVLGFYPAADVKAGGKWREVTVQAAEGKVKTIRGYYP
ncbi:MAG TPA: VWA domain-containing protein [Thermoanaerobaculia bacterium]|nr:VWA domain-containing protein [Thermoanaerobaculia bacterium]